MRKVRSCRLIGRPGFVVLALLGLLLGVGLSACGSSSSSSSQSSGATTTEEGPKEAADGVSPKAVSTVEQYEKPITEWPGPTEPFTPPTGTKVTVITCSSQGISCVRLAEGVEAAGETLGWQVKTVDGKGNPTVWNEAIQHAVSEGTEGIVLAAVVPGLAKGAVEAARKANIPVIYGFGKEPEGTNLALDTDRGVAGQVLADWTAVDSGGKAKVLVLNDNEFPELKEFSADYAAELKKVCPGCEILGTPSFTLESFATELPKITASELQSHPDLEYALVPYDSSVQFVQQGARQAGKALKVVGLGGDPPTVQALEEGLESVSMGLPAEWIGWQAMDAIGRYLAGDKIPHAEVVQSLMTRSNATEVAPPPGGYSGGFDYQGEYERLWGK